MKHTRFALLLAILLVLTGVASACKSTPSATTDAALTREGQVPAFFRHIPADSPYVFTGLEPTPFEAFETMFVKYGEALETLAEVLDDADLDAVGGSADRAVFAVLKELRGKVSRDGMESLGLSMHPHFALYGVGLLPVYRMELSDATAFEAFISRIEAQAEINVVRRTLGDVTYREYRLAPEVVVPFAIIGNEVVMGIAPTQSLDAYLPYMLGIKAPQRSLAHENHIKDIVAAYDLKAFGAGYIDIEGLSRYLVGDLTEGSVSAEIWQTIAGDREAIDETCAREYASIFAAVPRIVFGYENLTRSEMDMLAVLEVEGDLGARLAATKASVPGYEAMTDGPAIAHVGLGVDVASFVGFVRDIALEIQASPFECTDLKGLNQAATQMQISPDQLPPFIAQLRGISVLLNDITLGADNQPENVDALALVHTGEPAGLFATMQMFLPYLQGVMVEQNGVPAALPEMPEFALLGAPHVAMTPTVLAFSTGVGTHVNMASILERGDSASTPMFTVGYDLALVMGKLSQFMAADEDPEVTEMLAQLYGIFGKIIMSLDANEQGIYLRYHADLIAD